MDIRGEYESLTFRRQQYLLNAEQLADNTLPWLKPRGFRGSGFTDLQMANSMPYYQNVVKPYSNAGGQAISSLVSSMQATLTPAGADWFDLRVPNEIRMKLPPDAQKQSDQLTAVLKQNIIDKMSDHGLYAEIGPMMERLFVEGQVVIHVSEDELRVVPLRSFVTRRSNGKLRHMIMEEIVGQQGDGDNATPIILYTKVDYENKKVYQQRSTAKEARLVKDTIDQYIVVVAIQPQVEDYAIGYAWQYFGTIKAINDNTKASMAIIKWCAINAVFVDPTSPTGPRDLLDMIEQGKNVMSGDVEAFKMFTCLGAGKAQELAIIAAEIQRLQAELNRAFLTGIFPQGEPTRERVTAQEVTFRTSQLDGATQSLASTLMMSLQKPLVQAYMYVLKIDKIKVGNIEAIKPIILAGSNKLSKMVQINGLLASLQTVEQVIPGFGNAIDARALFQKLWQANGLIDGDSVLKSPEQIQAEQQALAQQQGQLPPGTPPGSPGPPVQ